MITYPAKITFSKPDQCFLVVFPDLPGCLTYGDDLDSAIAHAREALTGYLESIDLRKIDVPQSSKIAGKNVYYIEPEKRVSFALWLKMKRAEQGLSQRDMVRLLKIEVQSYQKFENLKKSNPTLKTIARVETVLHTRVLAV
ncbi:MAG: type II toxin-antitoxin system HicB family antitoxin [Spirochaetes bacterium]|nr:MAG: type II toxin-antitoxin system HicB family antitoxin [Spirochaetota bacterium]